MHEFCVEYDLATDEYIRGYVSRSYLRLLYLEKHFKW